jgi:hypothetical protein
LRKGTLASDPGVRRMTLNVRLAVNSSWPVLRGSAEAWL